MIFSTRAGRRPRRSGCKPTVRSLRAELLESRELLATDFGGIQGTVFNDADLDATFDPGEAGLPGVTIRLSQNGITLQTVLSDANGRYEFDRLTAGTYTVEQVPPPPPGFNPSLIGPQTVVITPQQAQGTVTTVIDSFDLTTQMVEASLITVTEDGSSAAAPEALGDERDLFVRLTSQTGEITLAANANLPQILDFGTLFGSTGEGRVTWDGTDNDPDVVNTNGLTGNDRIFTAGGATHFQLFAGAGLADGSAVLRTYTGAVGAVSQANFVIPSTVGGAMEEILVPFSSFSGADLSDVGALELLFDPEDTLDGAFDTIGLLAPNFTTLNFPNTTGFDLVLTKTVNDVSPQLGEAVTFTITVTNGGPANAQGIQVTDNLPAGMTLLTSVPSQGTYDGALGVWTVGDLANGQTATLQLTGTVDILGAKTNLATITAVVGNESNVNNNSDSQTVTPVAIDLSLTKSTSNPAPQVGQSVTFTIQVTNNAVAGSPATTATGVTILDQIPTGFAFTSSLASQGSFDAVTGIWTVGSLPIGSAATLSIIGTPTTTNTITNVAQVNSADQVDIDSIPGNNDPSEDDRASVTLTPVPAPRPAIRVVKRTNGVAANTPIGGPVVAAGTTVTFTYTVTNIGNTALANVQVRDDNATPANPADDFFATFVSGDTNGNTLLDLTETWVFQAQRTVVSGNHVNRTVATADGAGQATSGDGVSNHTGITVGQTLGKRRLLASRFRLQQV